MSASQASVREKFIKHYPGVRLEGRGGYWYRCANCGKWCGRPGSERANIPDSQKMEVDHIRPWSKGGSDEMWNLQPLCKPCNRGKSNSTSYSDEIKMFKNDILHGDIISATVRKGFRQNKVLKALGLNSRK